MSTKASDRLRSPVESAGRRLDAGSESGMTNEAFRFFWRPGVRRGGWNVVQANGRRLYGQQPDQSVIVNSMVPITLGSYSSWPGLSK